jgi:transposase
MESMARQKPRKFDAEFKERAVRLVLEWRRARSRDDGGLTEIGQQLGVHPETIRNWVNRTDVDAGRRPGTTTADSQRIADLERENRELRRANDILKAASVFFATELDGRPKR